MSNNTNTVPFFDNLIKADYFLGNFKNELSSSFDEFMKTIEIALEQEGFFYSRKGFEPDTFKDIVANGLNHFDGNKKEFKELKDKDHGVLLDVLEEFQSDLEQIKDFDSFDDFLKEIVDTSGSLRIIEIFADVMYFFDNHKISSAVFVDLIDSMEPNIKLSSCDQKMFSIVVMVTNMETVDDIDDIEVLIDEEINWIKKNNNKEYFNKRLHSLISNACKKINQNIADYMVEYISHRFYEKLEAKEGESIHELELGADDEEDTEEEHFDIAIVELNNAGYSVSEKQLKKLLELIC